MSQIKSVIRELKKILKANNLNYGQVAQQLNLSEASVKRLFAQENFSLKRLEKICQLINLDLIELFTLVKNTKTIAQLTLEQEQVIVNDTKLLLVATCVVNNWSLADILDYYKLTYHECVQKLTYLDQIKVIELFPKDRFKLKISPNFSWRPNGPIQQFFQTHLQSEFLQSKFLQAEEFFIFRFGMLSPESITLLRSKLQNVAEHFTDFSVEDKSKSLNDRNRSVLLMAFRPWIPSLFDEYKKDA